MTDKQPGDEEENKSANEPPGSSTGISNVTQTREQDKLEDDDEFDVVDAAPATTNFQTPSVRFPQLQDSHRSQPAVEEQFKGTNFEGPKIKVTRSNSSSEEDSAARIERNGEQSDEEEKEKLKAEVNRLRIENDELKGEKSSLEENLEDERSKMKVREGTCIYYYVSSSAMLDIHVISFKLCQGLKLRFPGRQCD